MTQFLFQFKNSIMEAKDIALHKPTIADYARDIRNSEVYSGIYPNYLNIKGYTYRLDKLDQRLFYTFQEAVYAIDLAKLTRDDAGVELNTYVYILVLEDCIKEYLEEPIDENLKIEAVKFYKKEQERIAKENKKYHMYQN